MDRRLVALLAIVTLIIIVSMSGTLVKPGDAMCLPQPVDSMKAIAHGNNLYLLWEGDTYFIDNSNSGSHIGNHVLYFKKSSDGGKTFGDTINLYESGTVCSVYPHMALERTTMEQVMIAFT
jgi:hypothetical protein